MANNVIFRVGTSAQFQAIGEKDTNTLYWLTDEQKLYKGDSLFAVGKVASDASDGLLSAADKAKIDKMGEVTALGTLSAVDASLLITDGDGDHDKKIQVQISKDENNLLSLGEDGLIAKGITYTVEKADTATEGYAVTYELKETKPDAEPSVVGKIDIPKDKVVKSGSLKFAESDDAPYEGAKTGDPYVELVIDDAEETKIDIPVKGMIDTSDFVIGEVQGTEGKGIIFNENDGGAIQFVHTDGRKSSINVHDGSKFKDTEGLGAQIYAIDGSGLGSRLNAFEDRITYISKASQQADFTGTYNNADYEIAIKKDLDTLRTELEDKMQSLTGIEWQTIGEMSVEEVKAVIESIATELGTYATITVDGQNVTAQVKADQGEVDINNEFGLNLLKQFRKDAKKFSYIAVKDKTDSKVHLAGDHVNLVEVWNFVKESGLQANKLKDLADKTLDIILCDIGNKEHEYHIAFSVAEA